MLNIIQESTEIYGCKERKKKKESPFCQEAFTILIGVLLEINSIAQGCEGILIQQKKN